MSSKEVSHHPESLHDVHVGIYQEDLPAIPHFQKRASGCDPSSEAIPWSPPENTSLKTKQGMKWASSNVSYTAKSSHPFPTPEFHDWQTPDTHTNTRSVIADWFSPRAETEVHMKHLPGQFSCFTLPMHSYLYTYGFFRMKNMQHNVPLCCCTTASDPPTSVYSPAVRAAPQLTFALSHCS